LHFNLRDESCTATLDSAQAVRADLAEVDSQPGGA
jgi:hypothetical protein